MALKPEEWQAIRKSWEYDPDQPSYARASKRAADKYGFRAPTKQSVSDRSKAESWERMNVAGLAGINAAAQRKADAIGPSDGPTGPGADGQADATASKKGMADAKAAMSSVNDAEDVRAAILAQHRERARIPATLMAEALKKRPHTDPKTGSLIPGSVADAFEAMKLAKITSETISIQQGMERKAWGLDIVVDPDQLDNLSDEQLKAIASGRAPPGMR